MDRRVILATVLVCTAIMLVAGIPLPASADTHHVVMGGQGPRASAVTWYYAPANYGYWYGHIVNSGLRSLVVDVNDITSGNPVSIMHQRIRFAAYPSDTVDTTKAVMAKDRLYQITVTPNGPRGTYCEINDPFIIPYSPVASFTITLIDPLTVIVNGSASYDPDGTVVGWGWEFGDGTTGLGVTATHVYAAMGLYAVTLTVIDNDGLTGSATWNVPPPPPPLPSPAFTYNATYYTVTVDASASTDEQGIVSYAWAWGDGNTGSGVFASHTYREPGTYTITLTVTNVRGLTASISKTVSTIPPLCRFTCTVVGYNTVYLDASTSLDMDGTIAEYAWDFGDGTIGSGITVTHIYSLVAPHTITLTVTDNTGRTSSAVCNLTPPEAPPTASFSISVDMTSVTVIASSSSTPFDIWSYAWTWGDGTSTGSSSYSRASHTYALGGTYSITLTVVNILEQTASLSQNVTIPDLPPTASFTLDVNGNSVKLSALASTNDYGFISYEWDFGDGTVGAGPVVRHTFAGQGIYTITLIVTDELGQISSVSHTLILDGGGSPPVAAFTYTVNEDTLSVNGSMSTSESGIISRDWSFGDWIIASGMTHTHVYSWPGTFTVTLRVTDSHGVTNTTKQVITLVFARPTPFPFVLYGRTLAADGVTPLAGCSVGVTDVRTGETMIGPSSDADGFYSLDLLPLILPASGRASYLFAHALGPGGESGFTTFTVGWGNPYMQVDVTLT